MKKITTASFLIFIIAFSIKSYALSASVMIFDETESQNTPGVSRMIFAGDLLRIDDGSELSGYILYNRKTHLISSISHQDKTVLEIKRPNKAVNTQDNDFKKNIAQDKKAPQINGKPIWAIDFYYGMKKCGTANTVKGLFKDELALLQDYYQTMQMDAKINISKTPKEFLTGCYINNYVNHVVDYYQQGFPIVIKREDGYLRLLKGQQNKEVNKSWLTVPKNYTKYSVSLEKDKSK